MTALAVALWVALGDAGTPAAGVTGESPAAAATGSTTATAPAEHTVDCGRARTEHVEGMAKLRAGAIDEAVRLFAAAAEHDPANAAVATDFGFALVRAGRRDEAEKVLRGAVEKDPKRTYAYVNLADLWATDPGRWQRQEPAIAFLEKGLAAVKDDPKGRLALLLALAGFERAVGRTAAARVRLEPLLAADSTPLPRADRKRVLTSWTPSPSTNAPMPSRIGPSPQSRSASAPVSLPWSTTATPPLPFRGWTPSSRRSPPGFQRAWRVLGPWKPSGASTKRCAIWKSPSTWRLRARRPGEPSGACSPPTAAPSSWSGPTRHCDRR